MRVLHVIPSVAPRYGGPSRAVVGMCRALRGVGVDTLIATTDADGAGRVAVEHARTVSYEGTPTVFFPRQFSEAYKYSRPLARWLGAHVGDHDVVHIHAVFSHASLAAADACRKAGVPYVVRPLGTLDPWSLRQKRLKKRLFWRLGVRRMLEGAAAIHYTAPLEKKLAEESLGLARGVVIPLGIELPPPDEATGKADGGSGVEPLAGANPYILVLSRLHHKKGLELLLPRFLALVKRHEFARWRLVLAGDGEAEYVSLLKRLVREHDGGEYVIFAGWLDGARRKTALQRADLLALTSYQENFGLCVVEALACGVPVLVSPHVNLAPEIESAGAGWISPLDEVSLQDRLCEILSSGVERTRRGTAGREFVKRFDWESVAVELSELYRFVLP